MSRVFDPTEIERELKDLEHQLSPSATRTTLYNLIVFTREHYRQRTDMLLSYLLGKRSIRLIYITGTDEEETTVGVSARCYPDRQNMGVCFQEIIIANGRDDAGIAPGTWQPLLIRDLPVYILWIDSLRMNLDSLPYFIERADKFVYDSAFLARAGEDPVSTADIVLSEIQSDELPVADITWKKLTGLRKATARLFDLIPHKHGKPRGLYPVRNIQITGGDNARAVLYAAWLKARLGINIPYTHKNPDEDSTEITFDLDNDRSYRISERSGGCSETDGSDIEPATEPCMEEEEGRLLMEELDSVRTDPVFRETLSVIQGSVC